MRWQGRAESKNVVDKRFSGDNSASEIDILLAHNRVASAKSPAKPRPKPAPMPKTKPGRTTGVAKAKAVKAKMRRGGAVKKGC